MNNIVHMYFHVVWNVPQIKFLEAGPLDQNIREWAVLLLPNFSPEALHQFAFSPVILEYQFPKVLLIN